MTPARPPRPVAPRTRPRGTAAPSSAQQTPHVYLLLGEEDVRAEQALATLLDELLPPDQRPLNLDVVDGGETPVREIMMRCETLPFFGTNRVVVVRRTHSLRAQDQDELAAYLEPARPPTAVILVADKLDKRRRLYVVADRTGRVVACDPLPLEELPAWVRARARKEGKAMAPEAARELVLLVGGGLRELGLELAKLAAYVGDRGEITTDDVRAVASHVAEARVFELMDAVGRRQAGRALALLHTVLTMGEPPVRVLYMLEDQLRMLLRTKALLDRRAPFGDRREVLGNRAWLFDRYREQVAAFGRLDAAEMLGTLLETDAAIKTGAAAPRLALETLIVRLCTPGPVGPAGA